MSTWVISSSTLILVVFTLRALLKKRLSLRLRYLLWLPLLLRLLIPGSLWNIPQQVTPDEADPRILVDPLQRREYAVRRIPESLLSVEHPRQKLSAQETPLEPDLAVSSTTAAAIPATSALTVRAAAPAQQLSLPELLHRLYFAGAAATLAALLGAQLRFSLRLRRSRIRLAFVKTTLPIYACSWLEAPCLLGLFRPAIYLPTALSANPEQLSHALAHEQTHLRHGDLLWSGLRALALALHWYNPLVWLAALLSRRDAELACDEGAITRLGEAQRLAYGRTLIQLSCSGRALRLRPVLSMADRGGCLRERVRLVANAPRTAAWALALAMLISLLATGCAFAKKEEAPVQTGPFYESEYQPLQLPGKSVYSACLSGDRLYAATEEEDATSGRTICRLYSSDLNGGDQQEFAIPFPLPYELPEDAELLDLTVTRLFPGPEGSVIALGFVCYETVVDDGILLSDGSTMPSWQWHSENFALQLDANGELLHCRALPETSSWIAPQTDDDGNIYQIDDLGALRVFSMANGEDWTIQPAQQCWQLLRLGDGRVALVLLSGSGLEVHAFDPENRSLQLIASTFGQLGLTVYPGAFGWDLLVNTGTMLYGVKGTGEQGTVVTWLNCDLDGNKLLDIVPDADGQTLRCVFGVPYEAKKDFGVATIRQTDLPPREERTVLTLGCMGLNKDTADLVLHFNRSDRDYRIEVKDYSGFRTNASPQASYTMLNAEIVAGQSPDLFCTNGLPMRDYAARGLLEDLWPYIDADAELGGRDALMAPLFSAMEQKGKLYTVAPYFSIQTVIGAKSTVGDRQGWSMEDFMTLWQQMPEGSTILGPWFDKKAALTRSLCMRVDQFLDKDTGICRFDSEEFRDLIRFSDLFNDRAELWTDYVGKEHERIIDGEQMLLYTALNGFDDVCSNAAQLGDQPIYVGLPGVSGNGSAFDIPMGLAMSASCRHKEAAWRFLRGTLDANRQLAHARGEFTSPFPTNRRAFDALLEDAMREEYVKNDKGEYVLDANGARLRQPKFTIASGYGTDTIPVYAMTEQQAAQLLALIEGITCMEYWDDAVMDVVYDEIERYYSGQKSLELVTADIQKRMSLYMEEQK
ncbi:MAG: hypothetical protein IKI69_03115 [Oscillospiraceae bacterium]|nr:hypothetical protein [Oscillospiraceae bacterium]